MPIYVGWMIPDHVFLTYIWGETTFADFIDAVAPGAALVQSVAGHNVHNWIDARYLTRYPHDFKTLAGKVSIFDEPNLGEMILISDNTMLRYIGKFTSLMRRQTVQACRSVEDGLRYLIELDPNIPLLSPDEYETLLVSARAAAPQQP